MRKTAVIDVVGLTRELLPHMPRVAAWSKAGAAASIRSAFPAVTCTAQSNYLTGVGPQTHGIVGNGWYFHDDCDIRFWRQSNRLVHAPKIWDAARALDPSFTCANLFWWYNMYSTVDFSVSPRPMYPADGRKIPDVYTKPPALRDELQEQLGTFPLFDFWGPRASVRSTQWIAESAKKVDAKHNPTLTLVYLPHLDYPMQRLGAAPDSDLHAVDAICGDLIQHFESRGARVIVLSEYGIAPVTLPIHVNRVLRRHGLLAIREELGLEMLDPGASAAFAVADHQVAHIYINDREQAGRVRSILEATPGIERVLDRIGHERSGDLVAVARGDAWFTYYYWLDDRRAPDFARTVDIHRKPGYDPAELFLDPAIKTPALTVGWKLLKKHLGFRTLLNVIPLDASLVKGSHGRANDAPLLLTREAGLLQSSTIDSTDVYTLILRHLCNE